MFCLVGRQSCKQKRRARGWLPRGNQRNTERALERNVVTLPGDVTEGSPVQGHHEVPIQELSEPCCMFWRHLFKLKLLVEVISLDIKNNSLPCIAAICCLQNAFPHVASALTTSLEGGQVFPPYR